MNRERVQMLRDMLAGIPEKQIYLDEYYKDSWSGAEHKPCGTIACIAGWARIYPPFVKAGIKTPSYFLDTAASAETPTLDSLKEMYSSKRGRMDGTSIQHRKNAAVRHVQFRGEGVLSHDLLRGSAERKGMSYGNGERRTIIFLEAALAEERKQNDHTMVTAGKIAAEMQMEVARLMAENERYKIALTELVACKDLKESINDHSHGPNHPLRREYYRRQPLAWVAARAALKGEPK